MHLNIDVTMGSTVDLRPFDLELPGLDMPSPWQAEVPLGDQAVEVPVLLQDYHQDNLPDDSDAGQAWQQYMSRRERHLSLLAAGWEQADLC
ncbi:hypothetical protein [Dictyobacter formicarum]|uniref:Uncharacterized protein n=1 Tax=Dictyobacter formicarum TaxID=2778368 RepID=A0ABQ3VL23_9CHLR|nr:hypothetical protein [Dictyobacter formicarum]GHO85786.1 hypothetical protein KSZ_37920 [Dictyobacter formicarum]